MRRWSTLAILMLLPLAGCLGDGDSSSDSDDGMPAPVLAGHTVAFRGTVEFRGERLPIADVASSGRTGFAYVSAYGPEPNIGVTSSGAVFTSAFSTVMRSTDGGLNWTAVHTHSIPGASDTVGDNNDPMLWVDPWTDRVYNAPMFPILACAAIYHSDDDGATWGETTRPGCGVGPLDHQKLASGPPGPDANPLAGVLWPTVAYLCYNGVATTSCAVSYDGGDTWPVTRQTQVNLVGVATSPPESAPVVSPCFSGQNGHPTVSPQGVVAFMRTWSCTEPILSYSADSGLTWTTVAGPRYPGGSSDFLSTANAHSIDPEVAFTPDGTMYVLFQGHDHHAYVARSGDLGASWQGPWDVTPPGMDSTVFAALAAGDEGRLAVAFLASNATGSSTNAPQGARWNVWIVTTEEGHTDDPLWLAYQVTDDDPVQVGPILQGGGFDNTRNLLDFIDGAVGPDGTFYVSYTDGCTSYNGCSDLPQDEQTSAYRGSSGAVAWLKDWSLWSEPRDGPWPLAAWAS